MDLTLTEFLPQLTFSKLPCTDLIASGFYSTLSAADEHWVHPNLICVSAFTLPITKSADPEGPWFFFSVSSTERAAGVEQRGSRLFSWDVPRSRRPGSRSDGLRECRVKGVSTKHNWWIKHLYKCDRHSNWLSVHVELYRLVYTLKKSTRCQQMIKVYIFYWSTYPCPCSLLIKLHLHSNFCIFCFS